MMRCSKCNKIIEETDSYEVKDKAYCYNCAEFLTRDSMSHSPTGHGCIGAYMAKPDYFAGKNKK